METIVKSPLINIEKEIHELKVQRLQILMQIFRESRGPNHHRLVTELSDLEHQQHFLHQIYSMDESSRHCRRLLMEPTWLKYFDTVMEVNYDFVCVICLNKHEELSSNIRILRTNCNHTFCSMCLERFCQKTIDEKLCCPLCRSKLMILK